MVPVEGEMAKLLSSRVVNRSVSRKGQFPVALLQHLSALLVAPHPTLSSL